MLPPIHIPPAPRKLDGELGRKIWFNRIFILPHVCVGIALIGWFVLEALVGMFGTDTTAVVTATFGKSVARGGVRNGIAYQFSANRHLYRNDAVVSDETYTRLGLSDEEKIQQGAVSVRVRYVAMGDMYYDILTEQTSLMKSIGLPFLAALIWNGIVFAGVFEVWIKPRRNRWLLQNGNVTGGSIISRRLSDKTGACFATVRFVVEQTGNEICNEILLPGREQYDAAASERLVTVVYNPKKPKCSLVYEWCGIEVIGAENTSDLTSEKVTLAATAGRE